MQRLSALSYLLQLKGESEDGVEAIRQDLSRCKTAWAIAVTPRQAAPSPAD